MSFALIDADTTPATSLFGETGANHPLALSLDTFGTSPADGNHVALRSYGCDARERTGAAHAR